MVRSSGGQWTLLAAAMCIFLTACPKDESPNIVVTIEGDEAKLEYQGLLGDRIDRFLVAQAEVHQNEDDSKSLIKEANGMRCIRTWDGMWSSTRCHQTLDVLGRIVPSMFANEPEGDPEAWVTILWQGEAAESLFNFLIFAEPGELADGSEVMRKYGARLGCQQQPGQLATCEQRLSLSGFAWGDDRDPIISVGNGASYQFPEDLWHPDWRPPLLP